MNIPITRKNRYTQLIYRPFWIAVTGLLIILTIALTVLINTAWHALHQTEPLKIHLSLTDTLQRHNKALEKQIKKYSSHEILQFQQALITTLQSSIISKEAKISLQLALNRLKNSQASPKASLYLAQKDIRTALHAESKIQTRLLHQLAHNNRLELETATFIAITLPTLGLLMLFFLRHRILRPLNNLNLLINRLGQQTPPPLPLDSIDSLLKPLFIDFNTMLKRLSDLEHNQQQHKQELEKKIRIATQSLQEYHQTLAESERLATLGELTAKLAHELRNPLAGIQLTLANLNTEIEDEEKNSRLTLVLKEIDRMTQLLNCVLDQSRHSPEPETWFNLNELLDSLLQLVQCQISPEIHIKQQIPPTLQCHLPEGQLRQALINLILNAAQSIRENSTNGQIIIEAKEQGENIIIRILDDGPGFPVALLKNGIQVFVSSRDDGTGLGLAIIKRFCHEQGGTLTLSNRSNAGACVELTLPRGE